LEEKQDDEGFENQLTVKSKMLARWCVLGREFAAKWARVFYGISDVFLEEYRLRK